MYAPGARYVSPEAREAAKRAELRRLKESGVVPAYNVGPTADDIPRYNRLAKEPSVKTKSSKHSGAWEFNKLGERASYPCFFAHRKRYLCTT